MKRFETLLLALLLWGGIAASAQSVSLKVSEDIPEDARDVLVVRFTQMLKIGGITIEEEAEPFVVSAEIVSEMDVPGSIPQKGLSIQITAEAAKEKEVFAVKGVGNDAEDAFERAAKQILPKSKAATAFLEKVKSHL